jgi:pimeloyl-ACP methyl ester carboxylesterase
VIPAGNTSSIAPTLILLPGLHGTRHLFTPLLEIVPPEISTRVIEHPTHECCTYTELFRRLESQLETEPRVVLLAESFSGPLAIQYAVKYPHKVHAVILCVSFAGPPVPRLLCYLATPVIWLRCPIPGIAIRTFLSGFRAPASLVRQTRHAIRQVHPRVLAHRVRQVAWINVADALKRCPVPILCLTAARDRLIGSRSTRKIRRLRPGISIQTIDAPHLLLQTQPAKVWQHIQSFLHLPLIPVPS